MAFSPLEKLGSRCQGLILFVSRCRGVLLPESKWLGFFGFGMLMSWFFGLGISMSWYISLHGYVLAFIAKTEKITHNYFNYIVEEHKLFL